jgi:hypothetical protein
LSQTLPAVSPSAIEAAGKIEQMVGVQRRGLRCAIASGAIVPPPGEPKMSADTGTS